MDYEEFKWALGDTVSVPLLAKCFEGKKSLGDAANRSLMRDFRLYMLVGGMPQSVATYLETNNMAKVDRVKRAIISLYEKDFNRIDPMGNASKLFHQIPAELNRNASRYLTWSATDGARANSLAETIWDKKFTENVIYEKMLGDKLSADLGYVYENMVAQMLKVTGHELYYYTFPTESGKHNYEVDFLIADGDKVCPIEVKSSGYKTHASLDAFCGRFSQRIKHKYLVYTKDLRKDRDVLYLPVYMTMFL